MPGRCRGKGIGPRMGSSVRAGGGGDGDTSRGAANSGGLVVFGLGQAIPRSEEVGAPTEAALSFDRGARGGLGAGGAGGALPVADMSPVVLAVIADEDARVAC